MRAAEIEARLVSKGRQLFSRRRATAVFSGDPAADALLNDLDRFPHAFVLGCIVDRQMKAEAAWMIPFELREKLGTFRFNALKALSPSRIYRLMSRPQPLHRYPAVMSQNVHAAIADIASKYGGDAARIWSHSPSSSRVVLRFLEFRGVGPKIANMAANILARTFKVPFSDYYSIDISPDVHVRRVFTRLGLVPKGASNEVLTFRARAASPGFPGLLDSPTWEIGRQWCRPKAPRCGECYMRDLCPSALSRNTAASA